METKREVESKVNISRKRRKRHYRQHKNMILDEERQYKTKMRYDIGQYPQCVSKKRRPTTSFHIKIFSLVPYYLIVIKLEFTLKLKLI